MIPCVRDRNLDKTDRPLVNSLHQLFVDWLVTVDVSACLSQMPLWLPSGSALMHAMLSSELGANRSQFAHYSEAVATCSLHDA